MSIKPLHDLVLIETIEESTATASGIQIASDTRERPVKGVVIAVGPGKRMSGYRQPMSVSKDDIVIFGAFSGQTVKSGGKTYLMMSETEIIAKLD